MTPLPHPTWIDALDNPHGIVNLYGDTPPSLACVEIREMRLLWDYSSVEVRLQFSEPPVNWPRRWLPNANSFQITLRFVGLPYVQMNGWPLGEEGVGSLRREDDGVVFKFAGRSRVTIQAELARFVSATAGVVEDSDD